MSYPVLTPRLHFDRYSFPVPLRVGGWVALGGSMKYWGGLPAWRRWPVPVLAMVAGNRTHHTRDYWVASPTPWPIDYPATLILITFDLLKPCVDCRLTGHWSCRLLTVSSVVWSIYIRCSHQLYTATSSPKTSLSVKHLRWRWINVKYVRSCQWWAQFR